MLKRAPGRLPAVAAIAALHDRAPSFAATDWARIDKLYAALEARDPSPVVSEPRVVIERLQGPGSALARASSRWPRASTATSIFHGVRGSLLQLAGRLDAARDAFNRDRAGGHAEEAAQIRRYLDRLGGGEPG